MSVYIYVVMMYLEIYIFLRGNTKNSVTNSCLTKVENRGPAVGQSFHFILKAKRRIENFTNR